MSDDNESPKPKARPPTVREVELASIQFGEKKWSLVFSFGSTVIRSVAYVLALWILMEGVKEIVLSNPENIKAVAVLVKEIRVGEGLLAILLAGTSVGWYTERKGKKRMTALKGKLQKQLEAADPNRSSSGLDANGAHPEEDA